MSEEVNYRDLPPIPEEEWVTLPEKLSQTFLAKFASCPRSAYLYRKYKGGAPSAPLIRGSLFHEVVEELTQMLLINEEPFIPYDVAREVIYDVLSRHPEWVIEPMDLDAVRLMVFHWCNHFRIDPETIFGIEQMWELELPGGTIIRGKVDLLCLVPGMSRNMDYKTSLHMKSQTDWEKDFQGVFYDVLIAFGHTEDGQMMSGDVQMFESSVEYPRYVFEDRLAFRVSYRDRLELEDHRLYLVDLVAKVKEAWETGKFPAISGSHCNECPASQECPLVASLRDGAGELHTHKDASRAAEDRKFHQSESKRISTMLRKWINDYGPVPYGKDKEVAIVAKETRKTDWDGLPPAIERAVELGEEFEISDFVKFNNGTELKDRDREEGSE
jgi:hypothetical protein